VIDQPVSTSTILKPKLILIVITLLHTDHISNTVISSYKTVLPHGLIFGLQPTTIIPLHLGISISPRFLLGMAGSTGGYNTGL
jgi:hypothetical protein